MRTNKERLIQQFTQLIHINSPSLGERQMADYLTRELTTLGLTVQEDDVGKQLGGNCGNLYAFLEGESSLPPILLCAHMDTVEPSMGKKAILEDGVFHSDGSTILGADDCSGIAAILETLRVIQEQNLKHRPIEILFTIAEEIYCKGSKHFDFSKLHSKEAFVLDYSGPTGVAASKAPTILFFNVAIHGLASHAGFAPQMGIHAIQAASKAIAKLKLGQVDSETTLNIGTVHGGSGNNVIPDLCAVTGEIRSYSHERALSLAKEVHKQFETSAAEIGAKVEFEESFACRAYEVASNHPIVSLFENACLKLNVTPVLEKTFGGSDNNVFAENGITGLVVSSAMYQCHSLNEYAPVNELIQLAELTQLLVTLED
ncbi:M20/M25/M40 family metallo-hydrolase [Clostridium merdae]|uniref:M20/M25/M40 family metallo-hydrolase n=1 Tax=Clostridium merdae TaxID=1958780 RepID=UPI000A272991|nr:M20/M25/M40 family metallo-hydrolase [Clostridium merdae]